MQLRHAMDTEAVSTAERASANRCRAPGSHGGFADPSTSPGWVRRSSPNGFEELAYRLATMARDVAEPPVRFIKTIGDAVMLCARSRSRC